MEWIRRATLDKQPGIREYQCTLVLGAPGKGKSTLLRDMIDEYFIKYRLHYPPPYFPRCFVHALSDSRTFYDLPDIGKIAEKKRLKDPLSIIKNVDTYGRSAFWNRYPTLKYVIKGKSNIQELTETISDYFRNGLTIWDEWTTYVDANPPDWQIDLGFNRRNYGQEVIYVCHMIRKVPIVLANSAVFRYVILFDTEEEELQPKDFKRFACAKSLMKAHKLVSKAPHYNKRVQYHIIIDRKDKKLYEWLPKKGKYQLVR